MAATRQVKIPPKCVGRKVDKKRTVQLLKPQLKMLDMTKPRMTVAMKEQLVEMRESINSNAKT
jgi:hypothetical protein